MKFSKIVEEMRTIRDYKKDTVDSKLIEEIISAGQRSKNIAEDKKLSVIFVDNGKELLDKFSGKAGYYGKIIEAPHYLVITSEEFEGLMETSGYMMETMRMKAWELGLGTCWLSIEDEASLKEALKIESKDRLTAFAAIGHPYKGIFKKDTSPKSSRLSIEEIIYMDKWGNPSSIEDLENRGFANVFYYAKFAPSWGNKQPWRFIIDQDKVILTVSKAEKLDVHLDAGIMMLYFERAAHDEGIQGSWSIDVQEDLYKKYEIPEDYKLIGYFGI